MPNLIEQQDLLKGLTDQRLSALLQQPTGDIPPFLVAAEAQRRQSIRQQFSGQNDQESVVDSLTRQLSGVPQNIQMAQQPMQQPQQGIAAIQPQGMNAGGYVQRYAPGGEVEATNPSGVQPWWTIPDYSPYVSSAVDWIGEQGKNLFDLATTPYSEMQNSPAPAPTEVPTIDAPLPDVKIVKGRFPLPDAPPPTQNAPTNRDPTNGQDDTSAENKTKAAEEDKIRQQLAALYADDGGSNWDEAQKWFAASQQFLQPDTELLTSAVNAAQAYSAGAAAEDRDARDRRREAALAMLKYDIGERDAERESAANQAQRMFELAKDDRNFQRELQKLGMLRPSDALNFYKTRIDGIIQRMVDLDKDYSMTEEQKAVIKNNLQSELDSIKNQAGTIMGNSGYAPTITSDQIRASLAGNT